MDSPRSQTTSTDQPNTWLELAIRGRLSQLCEDERSSFLEASPSLAEVDLLSYVKDYDERHKELSVMHPQAERLANFVRIMRDFMAGVSARSHSKPDISALVLGGIRAAVDASMAFETFFTKILAMSCRLADYIELLSGYVESKNVVVIESMATVIFDLLIFCRDVCRVIGKFREARSSVSIWTFIRTHWDPFETGFTDLEAKLKLHLEIIRGSAGTSLLDETYRGNFEVQMDFYWEQNREKADEKDEFLDWLSAPNFEKRHVDIYARKHPGTADWLFDTEEFKGWFNGLEKDSLWVGGKQGIGKSILVSNVIEYISTMSALDERVCLSYVYYDYRDETLQDLSLVISGIMKQACSQLSEIPPWMLKYKQDYHSPSVTCTTESFCEIGKNFEKIVIIVDALDECPAEARHRVLDFADTIGQHLPVKILITSRAEEDLPQGFTILDGTKIDMRPDMVMGDVETFIGSHVKKLRLAGNREESYTNDNFLEDAIIRALTDQSEGRFLWASLQLASLCRNNAAQDGKLVWEALNNLPSRLDDTYARLIYQIEGQDTHTKELALNTFLWVFHSRRPLSLKILKHALAVDHTHRNPADLNMEGIESIKNACGNLVHEENNTIRPIHRSFYEFIIKNTTQIPESSTIKAIRDAAYANGKLALSCLRCLTSLPGFSNFHGSRIADDIRAHPFRQYAANCFDLHLNEVEEISEEVDRELETLFTDGGLICDVLLRRKISSFSKNTYPGVGSRLRTPNNPQVFLLSTYLYDAPHIYDRFASRFGSSGREKYPLHLAAESGRLSLATQLLRNGWPANQKNTSDENHPLYYACEGGHLSVVSLLLEYDAEVNVPDDHNTSPLQVSSFLGRDDIVKMLLDSGADVNTSGRFLHGYPLEVAAYYGYEKITRMLLDHGADVNTENIYSSTGTALHAACEGGHKKIVQMLLDRGPDVNAVALVTNSGGLDRKNVLQSASFSGHYGIVRVLLNHGADINGKTENGSALQIASSKDCVSIVRLLLHRGADMTAQSALYGDALQAASSTGSEKVVRVLLEHGADVRVHNTVSKHGSSLQAAAAGCHVRVLRLLLDHGADPNSFNPKSKYGTPLQAASSKGCEEIVRILLDHGSEVSVHSRESKYGNALQAASYKGHGKVVQILLDSGVDVNAKYPHRVYSSALHAASCGGSLEVVRMLLGRGAGHGRRILRAAITRDYEEIVRLLLEHGADANTTYAKYRDGSTLETAILNDNENMVKLLLDHGADVKNGTQKTALHAASRRGRLGIVQLLLDHGADVNNHCGNALYVASSKGNEDVVRLLLDHGANVNEDRGGTTPTPLEGGAEMGRLEIVRLLLERGADVHHDNARALQLAGRCFAKEVVQLLVDRGAQVMPLKPRKE